MAKSEVRVLFGTRLRELRKLRGWSQEQFALNVGLDRSYVGGIERGDRNVSLENICLIARALGTPASELFEGWNASSSPPS
jgi:transcriptional regulator with XRE-family HTH domain